MAIRSAVLGLQQGDLEEVVEVAGGAAVEAVEGVRDELEYCGRRPVQKLREPSSRSLPDNRLMLRAGRRL
jgi:hypothetical protein